jgi:hypothetical protein
MLRRSLKKIIFADSENPAPEARILIGPTGDRVTPTRESAWYFVEDGRYYLPVKFGDDRDSRTGSKIVATVFV